MTNKGKAILVLAVASFAMPLLWAQSATDWPEVNGYGSAKYTPLAQITPENVAELEVAWTYELEPAQWQRRGYNTTPIMIDNVMYFPKEGFQVIVAINATTGEELWTTALPEVEGLGPNTNLANRGFSYWPGTDEHAPRVVMHTQDGYLVQLDAATGERVPGPTGVIDLSAGIMDKFGGAWRGGSPPAVWKNIAVVAGRTGEQGRYGIPGDPRGFDLVTGEELWRFHAVPYAGEPNFGTWGLNGWQDRRGPGIWMPMTIDHENGLVFLPMGNATDQNFGGTRPGINLYSAADVVLHIETGELAWYYQFAHHDNLDLDVMAPPNLLDTFRDGKRVPSVVQITKQGLLFFFNRLTGEPIWEIEERPVAPLDAPGDEAWPTQPFPVKPPPLARMEMDRDEVWTAYSEEQTEYCTELYDRSVQAGPYAPYGMLPSLAFPGSEGGGGWGGVAVDNERQLVFVNTRDLGVIAQLQSRTSNGLPSFGKSKIPQTWYVGPSGYPCQEPPWARLFAISSATADIVWEIPVGEYEELTAMGITGTGTTTTSGGPLATASGLVFLSATNDTKIRAFRSETGEELWSAKIPTHGRTTPLSYRGADGKQYLVAIAGGGDDLRLANAPEPPPAMATIVAYRLP
jgi:quinoprotein glucose dehydrogenase